MINTTQKAPEAQHRPSGATCKAIPVFLLFYFLTRRGFEESHPPDSKR